MGSHPILDKISQRMHKLENDGLLRQRKLSKADKNQHIIDFSHNDYLGLANAAEMVDAVTQGATIYGVGSKASPLVSGYSQAHLQLEQRLCELTGHEAGLLFCSGFSANQALVKTLFDANDVVIADKLIHASVIDGVKDSGAVFRRYKHNDLDHAEQQLKRNPNSVLMTESVFSMDGDTAPLFELKRLCEQYNSWLVVDDAHGFGVPQTPKDNSQQHKPEQDKSQQFSSQQNNSQQNSFQQTHSQQKKRLCDIQVVTFGKALGCQGAAILGPKAVIDFMVAQSRQYIYSTALSPASAYLALTAVNLTQSQPHRLEALNANIGAFRQACIKHNIAITDSTTAIQPVIIGDSDKTLLIASKLYDAGFAVGAIRPPTVPAGQARLRITINAQHNKNDIAQLVDVLAALI
ncbi:8-amino-7-oxononanoate synthase [Shewanella goraebulensis]|uniref:8-amino-7-oxononanoate synthase n=1 Tax=Shewanella goraebulensis TaxID=3050637 RepID=UPI00254BC5D2|nr:8-amino-7-oxononanoate synthase [Shewanella goraebulensis]